MNSKSKYAEYVPVVLILVGFLMIGLGWNGAAGVDYTQGQIPYVISGGLAGVGFIMFGCSAMLVRAMRRAQTRQDEQLERIAEAVAKLQLAPPSSSNGSKATKESALVIAGSGSFHLPTCRLVVGRDAATEMSRDGAETAGLKACRICQP